MNTKHNFGLFDTVELCCKIHNRTFQESGINKKKIRGYLIYCKFTKYNNIVNRVIIYKNLDIRYMGSNLKIVSCRMVLIEKYDIIHKLYLLENHHL